jgi:hypothetical protein
MRNRLRWSLIGVVTALAAASVLAQTPGGSFNSDIHAKAVSPVCSSGIAIHGNASGSLNGTFAISFECAGDALVGGSWRMVVTESGPNGAAVQVGQIFGGVVRGSVQRDSAGHVTKVGNVELTINRGTGKYAAVESGNGHFGATINSNADPQVRGSMGLNF